MFLTVTPREPQYGERTFRVEEYHVEKYRGTDNGYLFVWFFWRGKLDRMIIDMEYARSMVIRDYDGNVMLDWR